MTVDEGAAAADMAVADYERVWSLVVQTGVAPFHAGRKLLQKHPDIQRRLGHAWVDLCASLGGSTAAAKANPALLRAVRGEAPMAPRSK